MNYKKINEILLTLFYVGGLIYYFFFEDNRLFEKILFIVGALFFISSFVVIYSLLRANDMNWRQTIKENRSYLLWDILPYIAILGCNIIGFIIYKFIADN